MDYPDILNENPNETKQKFFDRFLNWIETKDGEKYMEHIGFQRIPNDDKVLNPIVEMVCDHFGFHPKQLSARSRNENLVMARHCYFLIATKTSSRSLAAIGRQVNRDHSTVIHGAKHIGNNVKDNKEKSFLVAMLFIKVRDKYGVSLFDHIDKSEDYFDLISKGYEPTSIDSENKPGHSIVILGKTKFQRNESKTA